MTPVSRPLHLMWINSLKLVDLASLVVSFILATFLSAVHAGAAESIVQVFSVKVRLWNFVIFGCMLLGWHFIFRVCGLYNSKRLTTIRRHSLEAFIAGGFVTLSMMFTPSAFSLRMLTPSFLSAFWATLSAILVSGRIGGRLLLAQLRKNGRNRHLILIVGTNARAIEFAHKLETKAELGYKVVGFVDTEWPGLHTFAQTGYRLCCDFDGLSLFLRNNVVDEVAFFLPFQSLYDVTSRVVATFEKHGTIMRFDADIFNLTIARPRIDEFDGATHITARSAPLDEFSAAIKWMVDILCASVLLLLLAPVFLIAAIAIKTTSRGPILFRQMRVGLGKRQFVMYKFRTMVEDAEQLQSSLLHLNEMTGPAFKMKNDPRITRVGQILRKTSIDELPQLLNVLRGDMSLVGPRAMSVRDYQLFHEDWQRRRFSVRPGITCLWQVAGRNSIPFEEWMKLDMQYIDRWSLWLDLTILLRTIPAVIRGTGAA